MCERLRRTVGDLLITQYAYRSGKIDFLLSAITHYHHFVKEILKHAEGHCHLRLLGRNSHTLRFEPDI